MNQRTYFRASSAVLLGLVALAPSALAVTTVELNLAADWPNGQPAFDITYKDNSPVQDIRMNVNPTKIRAWSSVPAYNMATVCLDIGEWLGIPKEKFDILSSAGNLAGINPNWGNPADPVGNGNAKKALNAAAYIADKSGLAGTYTAGQQTIEYAALQLAVWETLYDSPSATDYGFGSGRFKINTPYASMSGTRKAIYDQANSYLDLIRLLPHKFEDVTPMVFNILKPSDGSGQELFFEIGSIHVVPEPTTYLAGALLLVPFGVSMLRLVRNKPTV